MASSSRLALLACLALSVLSCAAASSSSGEVSPSGCCGRAVEPPPLACLPACCLPCRAASSRENTPERGEHLPSTLRRDHVPCARAMTQARPHPGFSGCGWPPAAGAAATVDTQCTACRSTRCPPPPPPPPPLQVIATQFAFKVTTEFAGARCAGALPPTQHAAVNVAVSSSCRPMLAGPAPLPARCAYAGSAITSLGVHPCLCANHDSAA